MNQRGLGQVKLSLIRLACREKIPLTNTLQRAISILNADC